MRSDQGSGGRRDGEALHRRADWSVWPVRRVDKGRSDLGRILAVLGAFLAGLALDGGLRGISPYALWGGAVFGLVGLYVAFKRTVVTLERDRVHVRTRGLRGVREWSEPLSAYQGVLLRSEFHSGAGEGGSYQEYLVELSHEDPARTVVLYRARKEEEGWRATWREASRQLDLPALEEGADGVIAHAPGALEKSVAEKAREGMLRVAFDPTAPPPRGLAVRVHEGLLEIRIRKKPWRAGSLLFGLILGGGGFLFGWVTQGPEKIVLLLAGGLILLFTAGWALWTLVTERRVCIGRGVVRTGVVAPGREFRRREIASAEIRSVKVGKKAAGQQKSLAVLVLTETDEIELGSGLGRPALDWLKDCLLASLARMG